MKGINKILIVFVFILAVFAIENTYGSIYPKVLSLLHSKIDPTAIYTKITQNTAEEIINSTNTTASKITQAKKVTAPGALVVPDNSLAKNAKSTTLTKAGVINITNKYRADNGLSALKENSKLDFSAEKKLQDMFAKQYFEHVSPQGVGVGDLATQVGYEYIVIGENLALGNFKDDQALVDAWMASPGHKANILNKKYSEIGVAVGQGTYNGKNVWMAVQHFGLPKSACPSIDQVLKGIIELDQNKISQMESTLATMRSRIDSGAIYDGKTTNEQIDAYNAMVKEYNNLIVDVKSKINTYNQEVRDFNSCISAETN